ncbi:MAG: hypothetical protein KME26_13310 [Oscillatoria princeps RMCB-10]|nr:hypothetical protein [Oscillatoria princeps RMCB-10]
MPHGLEGSRNRKAKGRNAIPQPPAGGWGQRISSEPSSRDAPVLPLYIERPSSKYTGFNPVCPVKQRNCCFPDWFEHFEVMRLAKAGSASPLTLKPVSSGLFPALALPLGG